MSRGKSKLNLGSLATSLSDKIADDAVVHSSPDTTVALQRIASDNAVSVDRFYGPGSVVDDRTEEQLDNDLDVLTRLHLTGHSPRDSYNILVKTRPDLTYKQVQSDMRLVMNRLRIQRAARTDDIVSTIEAQANNLIREAYSAWEQSRSIQAVEETVTEDNTDFTGGGGRGSSATTDGSTRRRISSTRTIRGTGNSDYLRIVANALELKARIHGFYSTRQAPTWEDELVAALVARKISPELVINHLGNEAVRILSRAGFKIERDIATAIEDGDGVGVL